MPDLHITEFAEGGDHRLEQVRLPRPAPATQKVTFSTSVRSAKFDDRTKTLVLWLTAAAFIRFYSAPEGADTTDASNTGANEEEYFGMGGPYTVHLRSGINKLAAITPL